jgi:hypothetical protein
MNVNVQMAIAEIPRPLIIRIKIPKTPGSSFHARHLDMIITGRKGEREIEGVKRNSIIKGPNRRVES